MTSVCLFGDSVAKGVIYDQTKKRYTYLKNSFASLFSKLENIPVVNYAKFGCTVTKAIPIVEKHSDDLKQFGYTALEFGGNDCDFNWAKVSENPYKKHLPNVPLNEFEENYKKIINNVRKSGSKPVLLSLPPIHAERFFAWITKGLNAENILKFLGDVGKIYRWHELYNYAVCKLSKEENVPLVDIRHEFLLRDNFGELICEDGMHPSEKGHELINEMISKSIPMFI